MSKIILLRENERIITVEQLQSLQGSIEKLGGMAKRTLDACDRNVRLYEHERCLGSLRVELIKDLVKELSKGICKSDCLKGCSKETLDTCIHFRKRQLIQRAQRLIHNV